LNLWACQFNYYCRPSIKRAIVKQKPNCLSKHPTKQPMYSFAVPGIYTISWDQLLSTYLWSTNTRYTTMVYESLHTKKTPTLNAVMKIHLIPSHFISYPTTSLSFPPAHLSVNTHLVSSKTSLIPS
jgi:hypothetical protein